MKVKCQNCGNLYDINERKITQPKVKFKCRQCQEYVYIYSKNFKYKNDLKKSKKAFSEEKKKTDEILMFCRSCRERISTAADFCPHCGESYNQ